MLSQTRIWTILTKQYSYAMLSQHGRYNIVQVIFLMEVVCQPWANIAQVKALCNIVQEAPDNMAQENVLFKVVLTLLRQHGTGKNLMQCCTTGSRQHWTVKIMFNVFLILLEQHCTGKSPVQCYPRDFRQHCTGNPVPSEQHCFSVRFLFWTG